MADPDSSLTPEQRLLKLIEEQESKDADGAGGAGEQPGNKFDFRALLSPAGIRAQIEHARDSFKAGFRKQKSPLQIKKVNQFLKIAALLFGCYLIVNLLFDLGALSRNLKQELSLKSTDLNEITLDDKAQTGESFFDETGVRNVFAPLDKRIQASDEETSSLTLKVLELTENLKLTGISIHPEDSNRTFCMIEDLGKSITTFLKEGDTISGLRVSAIKEDSVILQYQDEKIEIR
jgi:hypothetical protein